MSTTVLEQTCSRRDSVEASIGGTPLIRLSRVTRDLPPGVAVYAKAEHLNPGGSVKDRPALRMICDGEERGQLRPGMTVIDATSGNTGIAYAMIGAARGYNLKICLPRNASTERKKILRSYGVEIIETDPLLSTDGAQLRAREIFESDRQTYFYPDQYNNPANWLAHYETTAPEIWDQTAGRISHFVTGLGTSGTFVGTVRKLKELNPELVAVSMQPDSPIHGLEGLKHMATATVPGIYDPTLADLAVEVSTDDGRQMADRLAKEEGLLVGTSSGANVFAAVRVAASAPVGSVIVTVLCDRGDR
ncbi:MAG TPA: cysteine synthase family protein [Pyrinomonadaceae bacterium]